jgi:hypothetical protein
LQTILIFKTAAEKCFDTQTGINNVTRALWQRLIAGERAVRREASRQTRSKCEGTIEDHRAIALDVRELIRKHVFEQPVGSVLLR